MAIYSVYAPPAGSSAPADGERLVFVKDGFSFAALVVPWAYLLWHRLWLVFCGWLLVIAVLQGIELVTSPATGSVLGVLFALWGALEAASLRGWTLLQRGWTLAGIVEGGDLDAAERRFLGDWLDRQPQPATPVRAATFPPRPAPTHGQREVIGMFPFNGDRP
ncbi:DUF2628 domain-containing protein [Oryzibacter oryziterrae]|uniref:DUF2628 domain-containing protein n=1 Tax=Oryzibacter oryziterrae TaxID=2766474 RepID=UPI001F168A6E|nr:DUF2628 domain-containing protein [Oryzibacter oryziterrae]